MAVFGSALLAACATQPQRAPPAPAAPVLQRQPPLAPVLAPLPLPAMAQRPWADMVARFALDDCAHSPRIVEKARLYTRSPERFEAELRRELPLLMYVDDAMRSAGLPGEFTLLPMVESEYHPAEPSRHGDPGGMWQLMPFTARIHGVVIDRRYNGMLDPVASTDAAVEILRSLEQQFGDWRLVDMAYNAGRSAIARALVEHPRALRSPIPDLPVSVTTRNHLAKLMALACIIREPGQFSVQLPVATRSDRLATFRVPAGTRLSDAAQAAAVSLARLRSLNPGYVAGVVPADSPRMLLLPADGAQALAAALATGGPTAVANADPPAARDDPPATDRTADSATSQSPDPPPHRVPRHRVREGETLWSIARRFHVDVSQLLRWNGLASDVLHPGQLLLLGAPD
jgi:peptidoglycan lytic transglycosylase D